jgi:hypothetical protein
MAWDDSRDFLFLDCRDPWEGAGSNEGKDRPARTVSKVAPSVSDREDLSRGGQPPYQLQPVNPVVRVPRIKDYRTTTGEFDSRTTEPTDNRRLLTKDETADVANC